MPPNWQNRTMWTGDNLDIMRGMNSDSVDLIYLDPPFNSNRTYSAPIGSEAAGAAFKDTWTLSDVDEAWHGEIAEAHPALYGVIDSAGHAHGKGMKSYLIMMAVRLLEMRRLLRETGSIYLHCDDAASAYLKMTMDAVFGQSCFRGQVIWRRYGAHNDSKGYGRVCDYILFYSKDGKGIWNGCRTELDKEYVRKTYRNSDARGRFRTAPLHTGGLSGGGYDYEYKGYVRTWRYSEERMMELEKQGLIRQAKEGRGIPERKVYLNDSKGKPVPNLWDDVANLAGTNAERLGYPTQKPLALLDRIIRASSNEGDTVLDPFCGCATACVAADRLGRQWVGIDLSPLAADLVDRRMRSEGALLFPCVRRSDVPRRTDQEGVPHYRTQKHTLFGRQEGICAGCQVMFPFRNMTIDHVVPQAKGGTDHLDNLQLLCNACNSMKGTRSQAEFVARLVREKIREA